MLQTRTIGKFAAVILAAAILCTGDVPLIGSANSDGSGTAPTYADTLSAPDSPDLPDAPSTQSGAGLAACLAWTDGCIVCRRGGTSISCSNPGFACQPQAPKCLTPAVGERNSGGKPDRR